MIILKNDRKNQQNRRIKKSAPSFGGVSLRLKKKKVN